MSDETKFSTPFGILEEVFVRTVAKGNYSPVVHELDKIVLQSQVTYNEFKILLLVKSKTIDFKDTHTRLRRKDIAASLNIDGSNVYKAIKSLIEKKFLLEKEDKDSYFFYALNPHTFGGVIVLRSTTEAAYRLNRADKRRKGLLTHGKKPKQLWQKAIAFLVKYHNEDLEFLMKSGAYEALKYTLLKYTILNGLSAPRGLRIIAILEEANNPAYLMLNFVKLMHEQPTDAKGMAEELERAYRAGTDCSGRKIQTNAATYFVCSWKDKTRFHWQNLHHAVDMSTEAVSLRNELYEVIQGYPFESNVIALKRKDSKAGG